jgi:hypothetical protein
MALSPISSNVDSHIVGRSIGFLLAALVLADRARRVMDILPGPRFSPRFNSTRNNPQNLILSQDPCLMDDDSVPQTITRIDMFPLFSGNCSEIYRANLTRTDGRIFLVRYLCHTSSLTADL